MKHISTPDDLARLIVTLRKLSKLSQTDLAIRCGLSRTAIQSIEGAKETIKLNTLLKVLTVLNIQLYIDHTLLRDDND